MPWKDTLIPRQKFCSLRRTCAENDRPPRGAEHCQTRPLLGAQPKQLQPQRKQSHIVLLGMTKEMLTCIRRITKYLLILAIVLASLSVHSCRANWPEPLDAQLLSQERASINVMPLQSLHLRRHNRPTTEASSTLRLKVPGTLILKAWIEEGDAGVSRPRGRPKPALSAACCCSAPQCVQVTEVSGACLSVTFSF